MGTTGSRTFVIVGGGLAAAEAARTLRNDGFDGRIVLVADEPHLPYERPPLTKGYLRGEVGPEKLIAQSASFYEESRIEVLTGRRVVGLDTAARRVTIGGGATIAFDRLLIATGAEAVRPQIAGVERPWVHVVRTVADADRLREAARNAASVVVAGGGWIAAEAAATLRQMGLSVTLVVPGSEVLERRLGPVAGRAFTELHERNGVRVVRAARVGSLVDVGGRRGVRLGNGDVVAGDLAVLGFGASPSVDLAIGAGLAIGDGILVDEHLMTRAEGVFAAGDVASAWHPRYGERLRPEHWDNARRQGRTAGRNMLGGSEVYDRLPFFFSDQFDLGMELFGRPELGTGVLVRREEAGLIALWTRDGHVVAGMHTDLWDSRKSLERLVAAGASVDAAAFVDPTVPLDAFVAAPA